jgi:hypothetical protein
MAGLSQRNLPIIPENEIWGFKDPSGFPKFKLEENQMLKENSGVLLAEDMENLLCDPTFENAERFYRRWQVYKKQYPISVAGMPPLMKRIFEAVDSAGNQTGWEEEYYANRSDWERDDYAEIAEAVVKPKGSAQRHGEIIDGLA